MCTLVSFALASGVVLSTVAGLTSIISATVITVLTTVATNY